MPDDSVYDDSQVGWNAWRAPTDLPTPPSSDPPRRLGTTKQQSTVDYGSRQRADVVGGMDSGHQQNLTLPPIAHIDRHWPISSPLTPPDDEIHSSSPLRSVWRDVKPGPSRLHSPMTANASPYLASPSPSPIDEDVQYDEQYDVMDEQAEGNQDWDWEQRGQTSGSGVHLEMNEGYGCSQESSAQINSNAADWVTNPSHRSAHFIAEKTCEMVCYLWFSSSLGPRAAAASRARRERERSQWRRGRDASAHSRSPLFATRPLSNASTAALQFCASPEFVAFMAKLLATTQVSQSVIVLSLHYIFRLKERNDFTLGKPGSEFRVAVCALMLANKFVDDNTYTNKTWSEVSAIPLEELNKMEREFLLGVNFRLFVDAQTYEAWLNLLKGLVLTKEREYSRWREQRRTRPIVPRIRIPEPIERIYGETERKQPKYVQRARSTSPHHSRSYSYAPAYPFTFTVPSSSAAQLQAAYTQSNSVQTSPTRPVSSKRTAADAFSPTSVSFADAARAGKRPTGLGLDIPAALASAPEGATQQRAWERAGSVSAHPAYAYADSLQRLEKMSLATPVDQQPRPDTNELERLAEVNRRRESEEQTLAAPYRGIDAVRRAPPPHLYFYTLASSPLTSPYATSATEYASVQSPLYSNGTTSTEEYLVARENVGVLPPGAERKSRLRYVDSRAADEYGYDYSTHRHGYVTSQGQYYSQVPFEHQSSYPTSAHDSAVSPSSNTNTQSEFRTQYSNAVVPNPQMQRVQGHQQGQQLQHLPPLALALSTSSASTRAPVVQTQSACTSPLPGFASLDAYAIPPAPLSASRMQSQPQDVHAVYATQAYSSVVSNQASTSYELSSAPAPAPAPIVQSSWSAPPSETIDGVYAPAPRHVHTHSHAQAVSLQQQRSYPPYLPAPPSYGSYASPTYTYPQQQQGALATSVASGSACASQAQALPERAAFANAGPPGVANFYPYTRAGAASTVYGYGGIYNSSIVANGGQSSAMLQQSQSATASPEGPYVYNYDYAMRMRRL